MLKLAPLAVVVGLAATLVLASRAAACSAGVPTFEQLLEGSRGIVIGHVTDALNTDDHPFPDRFIIAVERTLHGPARDDVVVEQPAHLCGDGLGPHSVGQRLIIALDLRFYGQKLSPYWWERRPGELGGWAEIPAGVRSLDELAARIAVSLPDTATEEHLTAQPGPILWLAIAGTVSTLALFRWQPLARRRPS